MYDGIKTSFHFNPTTKVFNFYISLVCCIPLKEKKYEITITTKHDPWNNCREMFKAK